MSGFIKRATLKSGQVRYYPCLRIDGCERSFGGFRTKRDALARLRLVESQFADGSIDADNPTFGAYYERWLASKHNLKESTRVSYKHTFKLHVLPYFGEMRLGAITPLDVQSWIDGLADSDLSPATVARCYRYFRAAILQAVAWDLIAKAPTRKINLPRVSGEEMTFLDYKKIGRLLDVAVEPERSLYATLAFSGLRLGEALALRWSDIDIGLSRITITRAWSFHGGFQDPKTASSRRSVPLMLALEKILEEHRQRQVRVAPDDLLFSFYGAKPLDPANVRKKFLEALDEAELEHATLHSLRHSYASLMLSSGMNIKALQVSLGHASAVMTLNTYSHMIPGDIDGPVSRADAIITGLAEIEALESPAE